LPAVLGSLSMFGNGETGHETRMGQGVQDDLAADIARELQLEGTSVRVVESIPQQRVIDVIWAGKRAGRMSGHRVRTSVTHLTPRPDGEVAVVVVAELGEPPTRPAARMPRQIPRQRDASDRRGTAG
jgi:hypothetical protein